MKRSNRIKVAVLLVSCIVCLATSCSKGPAERIGQKIDNATQSAKDALDKK